MLRWRPIKIQKNGAITENMGYCVLVEWFTRQKITKKATVDKNGKATVVPKEMAKRKARTTPKAELFSLSENGIVDNTHTNATRNIATPTGEECIPVG